MTKIERFSHATARWAGGNPERAKQWYEELELVGPRNVRARLAQTDAGSPGAIATGAAQNMTIGFAQEWLAWHDQRREALEERRHRQGVYWTRWAALAATAAAIAAFVGFFWPVIQPDNKAKQTPAIAAAPAPTRSGLAPSPTGSHNGD